ncbi:MAG: hypothetical protein U0821_02355 [Chloroflexota bacterium]
MVGTDLVIIVARTIHALAAIAWIGAVLSELWTRWANPGSEHHNLDSLHRDLVLGAAVAFFVTGMLLSFERLSVASNGPLYLTLLAAKVLAALVAVQLALRSRGGAGVQRVRALARLAGLSAAIVLLAAALKSVHEAGLRTP